MSPGIASQTVASLPYLETTDRMTIGPSANPTMPPAVKSGGPESADHEQNEDEPELRSGADQAQERRRHQHAHASDQSQPDVLAECTEDWLGHRRGNPKDGDHEGEGCGPRIEAHLKSRKQRTQDGGHCIVDRVDERHEDRERRPPEDARLPDYVRHSPIMNSPALAYCTAYLDPVWPSVASRTMTSSV